MAPGPYPIAVQFAVGQGGDFENRFVDVQEVSAHRPFLDEPANAGDDLACSVAVSAIELDRRSEKRPPCVAQSRQEEPLCAILTSSDRAEDDDDPAPEELPMRSLSQNIRPSLIALLLVAALSSPAAAHRCAIVLPDGRLIQSGAAIDEHGRTCDEFFSGRRDLRRDDFARREFELRHPARPGTGFARDDFARQEFEFRHPERSGTGFMRDDFAPPEFEFRQFARPRSGFTTGNTGTFTTGPVGPFTTFSNSPPPRHR